MRKRKRERKEDGNISPGFYDAYCLPSNIFFPSLVTIIK